MNKTDNKDEPTLEDEGFIPLENFNACKLLYFSAERKQKPKELNQEKLYSSSGLESSEKMLNVYQKEYN